MQFDYLNRNIESEIINLSGKYKVLLVTGPRQVGKTTLLKYLSEKNRKYINLDDLSMRTQAMTDPELFLERYTPPIFIDEIQNAPQLLKYIKTYVNEKAVNGDIWLCGSQKFPLVNEVLTTLAPFVAVIDLQGLTSSEIYKTNNIEPFNPKIDNLTKRLKRINKLSLKRIYNIIWKGSMPALYNGTTKDWQNYYASYVQTFFYFDIMKILQINDEVLFFKFLSAAAAQIGRLINYAELAKAADISAPTAKQWIKTLESAGIIYLLNPFMPPGTKYIVKAPKLYFFDTGLAAYLCRWNNSEILELGVMNAEFLENWVVMEIYKSYINKNITPPLFYLKNFNGKEIQLIIYNNDKMYPILIKNATSAAKDIKIFAILKPVSNDAKIKIAEGGVICLINDLAQISESLYYIPVWALQ